MSWGDSGRCKPDPEMCPNAATPLNNAAPSMWWALLFVELTHRGSHYGGAYISLLELAADQFDSYVGAKCPKTTSQTGLEYAARSG